MIIGDQQVNENTSIKRLLVRKKRKISIAIGLWVKFKMQRTIGCYGWMFTPLGPCCGVDWLPKTPLDMRQSCELADL